MKKQIGILVAFLITGCAHSPSKVDGRNPSSSRDDRLGEALFFGRNFENVKVEGPEGNVVQDKYGDVRVIFCEPGSWMISVDPNRCGFAKSRGKPCTEMPVSLTGPWSNTFVRGNHYLTHRDNGKREEILSMGSGEYEIEAIAGKKPFKISQAKEPLSDDEIESYCKR